MNSTGVRETELVSVNMIECGDRARTVRDEDVQTLMRSMAEIGLKTPISVRYCSDRPSEANGTEDSTVLVSGAHRLEAARRLGWEQIECFIVTDQSDDQARMWEIAENLHRAEISALERSEHIAEWVKLSDKLAQVGPVSGGRGNAGGLRAAAREIGVARSDAQRAVKVAGLSDEAKAAARDAGLDDNRSALLSAAASADPVARISEIAAAKIAKPFKVAADPIGDVEANEAQVARLMSAWNAAGADARQEFLSRIDTPVMDRRFA